MVDEKILEDINPFVEACDKMVSSKFIMIDKRIHLRYYDDIYFRSEL